MTSHEEFRTFGKAMIDKVADYLEQIRQQPVVPDVKPGYMKDLIPEHPPEFPVHWQDIMSDLDRVVLSGITQWHSPQFHAYFPTGNSYPAIVADILSDAIGCIGFSWIASPACTEMEMMMMNWLGSMLQLPPEFLFSMREGGGGVGGGGVIQGTASEATLVAVLTAKSRVMKADTTIGQEKLVMYASNISHSSVERAALLAGVKIRLLETDDEMSLRGITVQQAMEEDRGSGLVPFCIVVTLGTTSCCSFDNLEEIGKVCRLIDGDDKMWIHVDAAYAGSAFICPEYRHLMNGVENATSFNFNPHKWMLVNFDCSAMWVKNVAELESSFSVDPLYLQHKFQGSIPDYRHWHIPLGRRFRSLKLWFVIRLYGVSGIQNHIRKQIGLAKEFERLVLMDARFKLVLPSTMGLVCFRLATSSHGAHPDISKLEDRQNQELNDRVNTRGVIHVTPSRIPGGRFIQRFVVCSRFTESSDIQLAWKEFQLVADQLSG